MEAGAEASARRGSWRQLAFSLAAFLIVPRIPQFRAILPIEQSFLMLIPLLAICCIVAWKKGGSFLLALTGLVASALVLSQSFGPPQSAYSPLARGWLLLLAAGFGIVLLVTAAETFFPRALAAVAFATVTGFLLALGTAGGPGRIGNAMAAEFNRRNDASLAMLREVWDTPQMTELARRSPPVQRLAEKSRNDVNMIEEQIADIPRWSSLLVPAMLALESLVAMALAWALYHRLAPVPLGPPLGRLRDFRFNDQLVWGVAVGASIFLLPAFAAGKNAGLNLLVFFGILYVVRGLGIFAWMVRNRLIGAVLMTLGIVLWPFASALAFGLGLGDTWLDWRNRAHAKTL
jgi:hypothetical protein